MDALDILKRRIECVITNRVELRFIIQCLFLYDRLRDRRRIVQCRFETMRFMIWRGCCCRQFRMPFNEAIYGHPPSKILSKLHNNRRYEFVIQLLYIDGPQHQAGALQRGMQIFL